MCFDLCDYTQDTTSAGKSARGISRGHEKLETVEGSGITSRGELSWRNTSSRMKETLTGKRNRLWFPVGERTLANALPYPIIPHVLAQGAGPGRPRVTTLKADGARPAVSPASAAKALHLPSFRGIVSQ